MLHELGPNPEKLLLIALLSDLLAIFLAKLPNRYHGAHAKFEGCFTLAPKVTLDPNVQQLGATNKTPFALPSIVIQRPNSFDDNYGDKVDLVVNLLY